MNTQTPKVPTDESLVSRALALLDADTMVFSEETHGNRIYIAEKSKECFQRITDQVTALKAENEALREVLKDMVSCADAGDLESLANNLDAARAALALSKDR